MSSALETALLAFWALCCLCVFFLGGSPSAADAPPVRIDTGPSWTSCFLRLFTNFFKYILTTIASIVMRALPLGTGASSVIKASSPVPRNFENSVFLAFGLASATIFGIVLVFAYAVNSRPHRNVGNIKRVLHSTGGKMHQSLVTPVSPSIFVPDTIPAPARIRREYYPTPVFSSNGTSWEQSPIPHTAAAFNLPIRSRTQSPISIDSISRSESSSPSVSSWTPSSSDVSSVLSEELSQLSIAVSVASSVSTAPSPTGPFATPLDTPSPAHAFTFGGNAGHATATTPAFPDSPDLFLLPPAVFPLPSINSLFRPLRTPGSERSERFDRVGHYHSRHTYGSPLLGSPRPVRVGGRS
ncbi:hypothetical protein BOTBODRAFT_180458 [Botryobasidium botryosum FD-172 SS1]|uniref:Uncharacterized protein n=1 Tax=Botryobasidium botryosum (strain FD-172 SS1) TaxID=930990 RepID=A0A067LWU2_BOTB1|nr:hypothetical protein BOTBODRAFT_180458 [Botryobasidium botryosum FD-172 SS1]